MRTLTAQDTALLTHPAQSYRVWIKVEIDRDGADTWVNLSDLNGFDWVLGAEYGESIDMPAWSATVRLAMTMSDNALFSLSPFQANSINNTGGVLIQPYRKIRISTGVVPTGDPEANASYNVVFRGRIDSYQISGNEITVNCRDQVGELQDLFIEKERTYGDVDPTTATAEDVEEIIQNIMDDAVNTTDSAPRANPLSTRTTDGIPYQLYSSNGDSTTPFNTSTGFAIREYNQTKMPVWEAIVRLSDLIGYQLRYRFHEGSGIDDFVLVMEEPDRAAASSTFDVDPTAGDVAITSVGLSHQDVRNFVRVSYPSTGTTIKTTESSDSGSITKYGRRFMEIAEGATSQIDTQAEANKLRDGALSDLKEPTAMVTIETPYFWFVQLNDVVGLLADNYYFDTNQLLSVAGRRNVLSQGGAAKTILTCQGLPKLGVVKYTGIQREYVQRDRSPKLFMPVTRGGRLANANFSSNIGE